MQINKGFNRDARSTPHTMQPSSPQRVKIGTFYVEGTKNVRRELFTEVAESIANGFIGKDKDGRFGKVTKTQLRRLFDEVKRFEQMLNGTPDNWGKNYPYIRMIKSKASYNITRAKLSPSNWNIEVWDNLSAFISEGIELIEDEIDYRVFKALFEAVYGFYYVKNPYND